MSISVEVWGDYACFSRPEMKVERVSYDVMTPSAARGLLEAIYWHPGMKWVVDRIHVCAPIRFTNIRRNEVKDTLNSPPFFKLLWKRVGNCIWQPRTAFSSVPPWCCGMCGMSLMPILK